MNEQSTQPFWLKRTIQLLVLIAGLIIASIMQLGVFKSDSTTFITYVISGLFIGLFPATFFMWVINRKEKRISFFQSFLLMTGLTWVIFSFQPPSNVKSLDNVRLQYAHHCSYCGKEYKGTGYTHSIDGCFQPDFDDGSDNNCSEKCCLESFNARN